MTSWASQKNSKQSKSTLHLLPVVIKKNVIKIGWNIVYNVKNINWTGL